MLLTDQNLRQMLRSAPEGAWAPTEDAPGSWLPVFTLTIPEPATEYRFGLLRDGRWTRGTTDRGTATLMFFPILEFAWRDVVRAVLDGLDAVPLPRKLAWTFPFDEVVAAGLRYGRHWAAYATSWIDDGYPLTDEVAQLTPLHARSLERFRSRKEEMFGPM